MSGPIVLERTIAIHHRLRDAGIPNAVGGALALAYHVDDPRATQDIDINVWVSADRASDVLDTLPADVPWTDGTPAVIAHDSTLDLAEAIRWVADLVGADDDRVRKLRDLCRRTTG